MKAAGGRSRHRPQPADAPQGGDGREPDCPPSLRNKSRRLEHGAAADGCTASIERRRGPDVDARIVGSDRDGIVIETQAGRRARISGSEIKKIDHPGNVLMTVGAVVAGLAILSAESQNPSDRAGADGLGVIGLSLFLGGAILYFRSVGAAGEFDPAGVSSRAPVRIDEEPPRVPARKTNKKAAHPSNSTGLRCRSNLPLPRRTANPPLTPQDSATTVSTATTPPLRTARRAPGRLR